LSCPPICSSPPKTPVHSIFVNIIHL
jgi:hypothetical protein